MAPSFDNLKERDEVRIILNALGYIDDESQEYVIHCLELDLVATGKTIEEAESNLFDIVEAHFAFADENNNWNNIFHPAPPEAEHKIYVFHEGEGPKPS